jgi:hypothetical protein
MTRSIPRAFTYSDEDTLKTHACRVVDILGSGFVEIAIDPPLVVPAGSFSEVRMCARYVRDQLSPEPSVWPMVVNLVVPSADEPFGLSLLSSGIAE